MEALKKTPVPSRTMNNTSKTPSVSLSVIGTPKASLLSKSYTASKSERRELFSGVMSPAKLSLLEQKIMEMKRTPAKSMLSPRNQSSPR
jgi:hypothetical protein